MPDSSIVSDTSPLLYLGRIRQLEVLPQLFSRVYIPEQVAVAGLLIRAKKMGILPAVKPYLEAAQSQGFYLHPDTYTQALFLVGER